MNKLFLYLLPVLPLVSCDKEDAQEIVFFPEIPIVNEEYVTITMSGFTVKIRENEYGKTTAKNALTQLRSDLEEIETLFSKDVIDKMKTNPIWVERNINDGAAWYHADKQWLIDNAMNPEKSKCVEISNYVNYVDWSNQNQPYMVLHELVHLYHDQALGYDRPEVKEAYDAAKTSGLYHANWYMLRKGHYSKKDIAYAMNNETEYLSEISEAYFGLNDYFPFDYYDLKEADPKGFALMELIWGGRDLPSIEYTDGVSAPQDDIVKSFGLDMFYRRFIDASGIPVVASKNVDNKALAKAGEIISLMLEKIPEAVEKMQANKIRFGVIGKDEENCDMPEYRDLNDVFPDTDWNRRGRGYGATKARPLVSCGEENILLLPGDVYKGESILVHEFAHAIHLMGLKEAYPDFQPALDAAFENAKISGLWKNTYAISNVEEYFAEGVQSYFNANMKSLSGNPDGVHNHVNTRAALKEYDSMLHNLISNYFTDKEIDFSLN